MTATATQRLLDELRASVVLERLDEMARSLAQTKLIVLLPSSEDLLNVHAVGRPGELPEFCRLVQQTGPGRRRCTACRSMIALSATARGASEHTCHGVVSVYAAPAGLRTAADGCAAVVSSCAFRDPSTKRAWDKIKAETSRLQVDSAALRRAFLKLPELTSDRKRLVGAIVAAAAAEVDHILALHAGAEPTPTHDRAVARLRPAEPLDIGAALAVSMEALGGGARGAPADTLVRTVQTILRRNSAAPVSVKGIARAIGMTPNHFSTLFRRFAGTTFVRFLTGLRIAQAKELLRDPTLHIADVAYRAGFERPGYFSRRFRQQTGLTPEQWRAGRRKAA